MHSVWRGAISFGLVNIPVRLYHASKERELKFKLLHKKDLSEIRYSRICKTDGKEVPWEEVVKGFELENGKVVVFTDEDFEKANPKKAKTIEIHSFAKEDEIDRILCEMPYYLEPEKAAGKAYALLAEALKKSKKVAIGSFIFRNHEHLGVIKAQGNVLSMIQIRYESEILKPKVEVPKVKTAVKKELDVALEFIDKLTKPFDLSDYSDSYTKELKKMIEAKSKGRKAAVKKGEAPSPKVQDILSLLQESLKQKKRRSA